MHIVFFFTYGYSLKTWFETGTLEKEIELYKQLITNHDFKITMVTYGDNSDYEHISLMENIQIVPIYKYIKYSKYSLIRYLKSFFIPIFLRKKIQDVDLIKQNQLMGSWISIIYKFLIKKPLIVRTGYDMLFFSRKQDKGFTKVFLYKKLTSITLAFSDIYTVTSYADKKFLEENFGSNINLDIRPNWVYSGNIPISENRYSARVLTVGRLESQKNYLNLIKNFEGSEYQLDIVGTGSLENQIIVLAKELGVKINLLGSFSNKQLINIYQQYKYFILASHYEGNPKVVLEAMSNGCIPVLSKIPNHLELVEHNINGILFDPSTMNVTRYLDDINLNNDQYKKLSLNATNKVEKYNSLEIALKNDLSDYKKLVGSI